MRTLIILFCCLSLTNCSHLNVVDIHRVDSDGYNPLPHQAASDKQNTFPGLRDLLDRNDRVKLLIVHGMGHTPNPFIGYSDSFINKITPILKLESVDEVKYKAFCSESEPNKLLGVLRERTFQYPNKKSYLRVYELTWSWATFFHRENMLAHDQDYRFTSQREKLNNEIKRSIISGGLSDAVLYSGSYRETIQKPFKDAFVHIATDTEFPNNLSDPTEEVAIISQSLGSYITLDTLFTCKQCLKDPSISQIEKQQGSSAQFIEKKLSLFFMFANQLPLLWLSQFNEVPMNANPCPQNEHSTVGSLNSNVGYESQYQKNLFQSISNLEPLDNDIPRSVIAINDPNDLLSYPITTEFVRLVESEPYNTSNNYFNMNVSIADLSYFGLFANPVAAHTGHEDKPIIINTVIEGY